MSDIVKHILEKRERITQAKAAGMGEVGIFWVMPGGGKLLQCSVPWTEGVPYGDFMNGPADHYTYWTQARHLISQIPGLAGKEYEDLPRGRVVFDTSNQVFLLYGSHRLVGNKNVVALIKREFNLTHSSNVSLRQDDHYERG